MNYIAKYSGESGKMMDTLEELDGFLWTNSLENDYKFVENKDQRSWLCETTAETVRIVEGAFKELEFTVV
jgi:hypothetical protein